MQMLRVSLKRASALCPSRSWQKYAANISRARLRYNDDTNSSSNSSSSNNNNNNNNHDDDGSDDQGGL